MQSNRNCSEYWSTICEFKCSQLNQVNGVRFYSQKKFLYALGHKMATLFQLQWLVIYKRNGRFISCITIHLATLRKGSYKVIAVWNCWSIMIDNVYILTCFSGQNITCQSARMVLQVKHRLILFCYKHFGVVSCQLDMVFPNPLGDQAKGSCICGVIAFWFH